MVWSERERFSPPLCTNSSLLCLWEHRGGFNIALGMLPTSFGQFFSNFWLYKRLVYYLQGFFLGTFIWTCHNENKDVIVLEGNKEMFDNIFKLLTNERFDGLLD